MNPYRRRFDNQTIFQLEYVYRDTRSAQNELPDHLHGWYEVVFVYHGRGTFFIDQTYYEAAAGDAFLIPGNTIHRSFPDSNDPKTSTALYFNASFAHSAPLGDSYTFLRCFEQAKRNKAYKLSLAKADQAQLTALLEQLHQEYMQEQTGYRQAVQLHLQHTLLFFSRLTDTVNAASQAQPLAVLPNWMAEIWTYIDKHLEEPLGLSELASRAAVTPAHFSRVFKRLTGMNVTEYVTTKRIIYAKELLLEIDDNIADFANRCGFESVPYFHRMFKKMTGMTPAAYKRNF